MPYMFGLFVYSVYCYTYVAILTKLWLSEEKSYVQSEYNKMRRMRSRESFNRGIMAGVAKNASHTKHDGGWDVITVASQWTSSGQDQSLSERWISHTCSVVRKAMSVIPTGKARSSQPLGRRNLMGELAAILFILAVPFFGALLDHIDKKSKRRSS